MASLLYPNKSLILPREPSLLFRRDQPHPFADPSDNHFPFPLLPTPKPKAVFVLGSSGTGKSKLAINLALRFSGEIINSDKMQFYDGLPIITNKVTPEECAGVPHHLLGGIHPETDFTAAEFCHLAAAISDQITARNRLPVIAGGSNSFVKELIAADFTRRYDCCFIWMDAEQDVLDEFVAERVDRMVEKGLVEEARGVFQFDADYTRGVRRSIGVPELDQFFRREAEVGEGERRRMMEEAIGEIKASTCRLTRVQREKIRRFGAEDGWRLNRVDATAALLRRGAAVGGVVWEDTVVGPSIETVRRFLGGGGGIVGRCSGGAAEIGEENLSVEIVGPTK